MSEVINKRNKPKCKSCKLPKVLKEGAATDKKKLKQYRGKKQAKPNNWDAVRTSEVVNGIRKTGEAAQEATNNLSNLFEQISNSKAENIPIQTFWQRLKYLFTGKI